MVVVPPETPVNKPVDGLIVATPVEPDVHVPPVVTSVSVVEVSAHNAVVPLMDSGSGFTVTIAVIIQLVGKVNVSVAVPIEAPVTIPDAEPIGAIAVLLLAHVPAPDASVSAVVKPSHTVSVPLIGAGNALTVTIAVT